MSRKSVIIAAVTAVAVVGGGAAVLWPNGATPVATATALEDYRARADDRAAEMAAGTPAPGVYTFAAGGQEVIKLGPLPAETRPYPATMPLMVVGDERPSCFTVSLNLLEQHKEATTYCADADGTLRIDGHTKQQQVGPMSPVAKMTCDPAVLHAPGRPAAQVRCRMELSGGPARITTTLDGAQ